MSNKILITGLLQILISTMIFAQEEETLSISLKEAQNYAIEHNKTLKNSSIEIQKAEAAHWEALSSMLPQVDANFDYSNYCGYEMKLSGFSIPMNPSGTFGLTASLAITGSQIVGIQMAKLSQQLSNINYDQSEQEISYQVSSIYMSILVMKNTVNLLDQSLKNMETLQKATQEAVLVGTSEQTDADKLMVQVLSLKTSINSTKRSLEMLENSLRLQLGTGVNTTLNLTQSIEDILNPETALSLLNKTFTVENNFNYQILMKNSEILKKQIDMKTVSYLPTLTAYYKYSAKTYFGKAEGMNMTPPNLVGASLNIPIWSSGSRFSSLKQAKLNYDAFQNTIETTKDGLLVQERQLRYNLSSAYETYEAQKLNLDVTQRVFTNISNKYEQGMSSSLELTNASSDIISAQSSYISAVLELVNAQIEFEKLLNNR